MSNWENLDNLDKMRIGFCECWAGRIRLPCCTLGSLAHNEFDRIDFLNRQSTESIFAAEEILDDIGRAAI